ncbi:glycogen synthase [Kitasatospora albolonga]|uniref:glycosyltransferase family 4 protein n=1 Tax=Kitasatospora albolonga TaxID=68173 RepID=UPI0031F0D8A5
MRVDLLTRQYPTKSHNGADAHTTGLTRALRRLVDVRVRCFDSGPAEPDTYSYREPGEPSESSAFQFLNAGLGMADDCFSADLVHSHTWFTNAAGHVAGRLYGIPHVMTMHSLAASRAGDSELPDGEHALSDWMERSSAGEADALITGSAALRDDVLAAYPEVSAEKTRVIRSGIDTELWRPDHGTAALERFEIDPERPIVLFVGRPTRRRGLPHLLRAAAQFRPEAQLVLCCDGPGNPEVELEVAGLVDELTRRRSSVIRIGGAVTQPVMRQLIAQATAFVQPSLREPTGAVNLKAMACGTAVVATAVGGVPEFVEHGDTGLLIRYQQQADGTGDPVDPEQLAADLATSVNTLIDDPELARRLGAAGRRRAADDFSWDEAADRTLAVYRQLTAGR